MSKFPSIERTEVLLSELEKRQSRFDALDSGLERYLKECLSALKQEQLTRARAQLPANMRRRRMLKLESEIDQADLVQMREEPICEPVEDTAVHPGATEEVTVGSLVIDSFTRTLGWVLGEYDDNNWLIRPHVKSEIVTVAVCLKEWCVLQSSSTNLVFRFEIGDRVFVPTLGVYGVVVGIAVTATEAKLLSINTYGETAITYASSSEVIYTPSSS